MVSTRKLSFQSFHEAGSLQVTFRGNEIDVLQFAYSHRIIQELLDLSVYQLSLESPEAYEFLIQNFGDPIPKDNLFGRGLRAIHIRRPIRLKIREVRVGSIQEDLVFQIAQLLGNSDFRDLFLNIGASLIYDICKSLGQRLTNPLRKRTRRAEDGPIEDYRERLINRLIQQMNDSEGEYSMSLEIDRPPEGGEKISAELIPRRR
jgi:hypothetical protein